MKKSAITKSVDAPKHMSPKDPGACTERTIARALMPPILIMLVSESVAADVGIGHTGVIRHDQSAAELPSYYEVWLVGQAGLADYVSTMQGVMNDFHAHRASSVLKMHA
jgi:hypothetical protein